MQSLGFENYAEALKIYLGKYREVSAVCCEKGGHLIDTLLYFSIPTRQQRLTERRGRRKRRRRNNNKHNINSNPCSVSKVLVNIQANLSLYLVDWLNLTTIAVRSMDNLERAGIICLIFLFQTSNGSEPLHGSKELKNSVTLLFFSSLA